MSNPYFCPKCGLKWSEQVDCPQPPLDEYHYCCNCKELWTDEEIFWEDGDWPPMSPDAPKLWAIIEKKRKDATE